MIGDSGPSFSLGLDFDLDQDLDIADVSTDDEHDPHPLPTPPEPSNPPHNEPPTFELFSDQDIDQRCDLEVESTDLEPVIDPPRPALKRLRRGAPDPEPEIPSGWRSVDDLVDEAERMGGSGDDDIEEFSSQDEGHCSRVVDKHSLAGSNIYNSASKFSLANHGIVTSQSTAKLKTSKWAPASDVSASSVLTQSNSKKIFPRLATSPLRKIHLLDSDSDDQLGQDADAIKMKCSVPTSMNEHNGKLGYSQPKESLWKNFSPKGKNVATPFLDEFCAEYFSSVKESKAENGKEGCTSFHSSKVRNMNASTNDYEVSHQQQSVLEKLQDSMELSSSEPPAYKYFCHDDTKIQALVKVRLCHFTPLGLDLHRGKNPAAESLNYMGQFTPKDARSHANITCPNSLTGTSRKGKRAEITADWIDPRSSVGVPKDAGKRRVHAGGQQLGHWLTEGGRKVYISKNGQELTGQLAYRQYKRESGTGYRKQKKKAAGSKRPASKNRRK